MSSVANSLPTEALLLAADIALIDRHMSRYTWLVDARRYAEWAELFTADAIFEQAWQDDQGNLHPVNFGAGLRLQGRTNIARFVAARFGPTVKADLPRPAAGVGHRLVNRLIAVDGNSATLKGLRTRRQFPVRNGTTAHWRGRGRGLAVFACLHHLQRASAHA